MTSRLSSSAASLETDLTKVGESWCVCRLQLKRLSKASWLQQSASISMIKPQHPVINALISEDLARNSNMDVKISVACCICEIMKIMAPNTPYDENQMKEFFELVVTMFEKVSLSDEGYTKMIKVLKALSSGEFVVMMCHLAAGRTNCSTV